MLLGRVADLALEDVPAMSVMTWAQTEAETWEALAVKAGAIEVTARELCSRKWSQSAPGGAA